MTHDCLRPTSALIGICDAHPREIVVNVSMCGFSYSRQRCFCILRRRSGARENIELKLAIWPVTDEHACTHLQSAGYCHACAYGSGIVQQGENTAETFKLTAPLGTKAFGLVPWTLCPSPCCCCPKRRRLTLPVRSACR
jgi:hypothetical protein